MECLKVAESKARAAAKRDLRISRARSQKSARSNVLDAIARVHGTASVVPRSDDDGVVRMKIVVKKQDLKQVLEVMRGNRSMGRRPSPTSLPAPMPSLSLEQRLNVMRRRHFWRASHEGRGSHGCTWRPALQSIPEELQT